MTTNEFVELVRREMEQRGLSQNQLEQNAGLGRGVLSRMFAGKLPGEKVVVRLASALGMDADDLLRRAGLPTAHRPAAPGASELSNLYAQLDDEGQEDILAMVRAFVARRLARGKNRHAQTSHAPD